MKVTTDICESVVQILYQSTTRQNSVDNTNTILENEQILTDRNMVKMKTGLQNEEWRKT